jgi:hypothetical protein
VVVTGKIEGDTRASITEKITRAGGRTHPAVSSHVDLLVVGERAGSKLRKARELGIPVMTVAELRKLVEALAYEAQELVYRERSRLLEATSGSEAAPIKARLAVLSARPVLAEARLKAAQRDKLGKGEFAIPEKRAYPIHDENHARAALSMVAKHGSPEEKARVRAAVKRRYPGIGDGDGERAGA